MEQKYKKEQRKVEKNHQTQWPLWLLNNTNFCYEGEKNNNCFYNIKENKNTIETYTNRSKCMGKKFSFAAVFKNITRIRVLPEEVSIDFIYLFIIFLILNFINSNKY